MRGEGVCIEDWRLNGLIILREVERKEGKGRARCREEVLRHRYAMGRYLAVTGEGGRTLEDQLKMLPFWPLTLRKLCRRIIAGPWRVWPAVVFIGPWVFDAFMTSTTSFYKPSLLVYLQENRTSRPPK